MMMIATPSTIQLSQQHQVFFFNGNKRDLPVSRSRSSNMMGRRRERTGCCSTRSRNHHLNHATILIQEHRYRSLALRRQYNSNTNDSNSSMAASLEMIVEEDGEEEEQQQYMKYKYDDDDDDDTITTANTTSSSVSSSPSSSSSSSSVSSFSPPSTIPILSGTDFYWQSQRKSLSSLAYYY